MARIRGTTAGETLTGTGAADVISGNSGNDLINAGIGNDYVTGDAGNDTLNGQDGNDKLLGGTGIDTINGGDGNDYMDGGYDADTISGGIGNDTLLGSVGNDALSGGDGDDIVNGGVGNDTLSGNAGNDKMIAALGVDVIDGGTDTRAIVVTSNTFWSGGDWLSYSDSSSGVNVNMQTSVASGGAAGDTWANVEHLEGSRLKDTLTGSDTVAGIIAGGAGNDTIYAGAVTDDVMRGDAGDDLLVGKANSRDYFQAQINLGLDRYEAFDKVDLDPGETDLILVSKSGFNMASNVNVVAGSFLHASAFETGTSHLATSATTRFIYETDTKILWADLDGSGSVYDPVAVAVIDGVASLSASDFAVIG